MGAAADRDTIGVAGDEAHASIGTPSHSAINCAKLVSWPWPCEVTPMTSSTMPSGETVISAFSRGTPVEVST